MAIEKSSRAKQPQIHTPAEIVEQLRAAGIETTEQTVNQLMGQLSLYGTDSDVQQMIGVFKIQAMQTTAQPNAAQAVADSVRQAKVASVTAAAQVAVEMQSSGVGAFSKIVAEKIAEKQQQAYGPLAEQIADRTVANQLCTLEQAFGGVIKFTDSIDPFEGSELAAFLNGGS